MSSVKNLVSAGYDTIHRRYADWAGGLDVVVDTVETSGEDGEPVIFQWVVARKP